MILFDSHRLGFPSRLLLALLCVAAGWFYGLRISPLGLATLGRAIPPCVDLYPAWYGSRAVLLHHADPYSPQLTVQIQKAVYGHPADPGADQQFFAYPLPSALLFLPFALLPLHLAKVFAFVVFGLLLAASTAWWTSRTSPQFVVLATLLAAATFPCYYALVALQPTVLIASLMAASYAAARRGHFALSGALLALACAKPQLALALLLPLFLWVLHDLRARRALPLAFLGSGLLLLAFGQFLRPGWLPEWLHILRAYSGYARATPVLWNLGKWPGLVLTVPILAAVAYAAWRRRHDLAFTSALCIATLLLVAPLHIYDQYLLLVPILWIFVHRSLFSGWTGRRLLLALDIALTLGWFWQLLLVPVYFLSRHAATLLWGVPFGISSILPFAAFLPLLYRAFRIPGDQQAPAPDLLLQSAPQ